MQRRQLMQAAAAGALAPLWARAQGAWPTKPMRIVVPFTPGGTTDYVTRLVAVEVAKSLGQPVVVENKPGAGTVIGVDSVAKSAADGTSFVTVANSFTVNHTLLKKLPYDGLKDLRPVALMGLSEHVLATHPGSGLKSVADIVAQARAGAKLSYASFGAGTSAHLAGEMLKSQLGIDVVHVPYKGQAPALADLLGGQVSMMFGNWPEFRNHVQAGKLVAIGMATARRSAYAPAIPTLAEQGLKVESNSWNGLLAPAGTPDAVVQRMNAAVNQAMQSPAVVDAFQKGGIAAKSGTPEQFADFIRSEIARYADVIRKAGITAEA
ncbi:tripartite tricarboxylate transporter substrate binding protein [Ottowia sp.]|uniref:tripartite tricarboxylate transporter substrate binding protein n=1 Tax=Ottowia sp. TaxID=1898956 RepID=UPI002D055F81|nr:tripartite tricarboxylate transporter substrate binding protein [Ottowia sp.]HOB67708.1 tripartite tricarboxylate transporter substrate binding protein [Ottowia sp.]HPZ57088.1 tripartite tricarboxylate transporter substrate binding protein [Ottowia sp.]HQD48662.1 tripartite tricarboxylate transporter substrate binding protein [Ottowia sp.]